MNSLVLSIIVRSREKVLYEERVQAVTSLNQVGIFDVLPKHENFISIIKEFLILHRSPTNKEHVKIDRGVLKVKNDKVEVYLGI